MAEEYDEVFDKEPTEEQDKKPEKPKDVDEVKKHIKDIKQEKVMIQKELQALKNEYLGRIKAIHLMLFGNPAKPNVESATSKLEIHLEDQWLQGLEALNDIKVVWKGAQEEIVNYRKLQSTINKEITKVGTLLDRAIVMCDAMLYFYEHLGESLKKEEESKKAENIITEGIAKDYIKIEGQKWVDMYIEKENEENQPGTASAKGNFKRLMKRYVINKLGNLPEGSDRVIERAFTWALKSTKANPTLTEQKNNPNNEGLESPERKPT